MKMVIWIVLSLSICSSLADAKESFSRHLNDPFKRITRIELSNGTIVYMAKIQSNTVTVNFDVKVGWQDEDSSNFGVSHLLEHLTLASRDSTDRSIDSLLLRQGGKTNGNTSRNKTIFMARASKEDVKLLLDTLTEMVFKSSFSSVSLQNEIKTIEIEYAAGGGRESARNSLAFSLFGVDNGKKRSRRAELEALSRITLAHVRQFKELYYQPRNAIIYIAGSFDGAEITKHLATTVGLVPNFSTKPTMAKLNSPIVRGTEFRRFSVSPKDVGQVFVGSTATGLNPQDREVLRSFSLWAASNIRAKARTQNGSAYSVSSESWIMEDFGYFGVSLDGIRSGLRENLKLAEAFFETTAAEGNLTDEQIKEAIDLHLNRLQIWNSTDSQMLKFAREMQSDWEIYGHADSPIDILKEVDENTYRNVLKKYFIKKNQIVKMDEPSLFFAGDLIALPLILLALGLIGIRAWIRRKPDPPNIPKFPLAMLGRTLPLFAFLVAIATINFVLLGIVDHISKVVSKTYSTALTDYLFWMTFSLILLGSVVFILSMQVRSAWTSHEFLFIDSFSRRSLKIAFHEISQIWPASPREWLTCRKPFLYTGFRDLGLAVRLKNGKTYVIPVSKNEAPKLKSLLSPDHAPPGIAS